MAQFSSGVGLVPEQAWEDPDLAASPYGSDPTTASIGFTDGKAAGSASPLTWAQAQELRLILAVGAGHTLETPAVTTNRYVRHRPPGSIPVTLTAPAPGSTVTTATTAVTGTTLPGANVVVESYDSTTSAPSTTATAVAAPDGSFSVTVPVGFGDSVLTAAATASGNRTGYAQTTVTSNVTGGTTVLDVTDPAGDDNGPGTYQYPTAADFHAGAFDLTRFHVISDGTTVYLQATLANLDPTFGAALGAQLLDVYVHNPAATTTSTAAAYLSRNYTIAPAEAWSELVEVQGFASPVWQDPAGNSVGTASVAASQTQQDDHDRAAGGRVRHPGAGLVVRGGADRAGRVQPRPGAQLRPDAAAVPVRGVRGRRHQPDLLGPPGHRPKAMDIITPAGVSQATELDPTLGQVVIQGVAIP